MSQTPNPKLVKLIATYLRTPSKAESKLAEPRLADRVTHAVRQNREKVGRATGILWRANPTPTMPPNWTPAEAARFMALVARTDELNGNCG